MNVVLPPERSSSASLIKGFKSLPVEVFIAELPIEALDVAVLLGPPRLNQQMADAVLWPKP